MTSATDTYYSFGRLRASLIQFGCGQVLNGLLGFGILLQIARGLSLPDYGAYVVFIALVQTAMTISMSGLDAVAAIYVPQHRISGTPHALRTFLVSILGLRFLTLLGAVVLFYLAAPVWAFYFKLERWESMLLPYVGLIVAQGLLDYWQRGIFQPLLRQRAAQGVALARSLLFSALLGGLAWQGSGDLALADVVRAECWSSGCAAVLGMVLFARWWKEEKGVSRQVPIRPLPSLGSMWKMGGYSYASQLLYSMGDAQIVLLLAGHLLDYASTAALGFCLGLYGQLLRYLPAYVLWGAIQSSLVATYHRGKDFGLLNRQAMLLYKGSLFVIAPVVAFFAVSSEGALNLLSGYKYGEAHGLALTLLLALIPASHRIVLAGLVNTVEQPQAGAMGNLASLTTVPIGITLVASGWGAFGLVLTLISTAVLYNIIVIRTLQAVGHRYQFDYPGLMKIGLAIGATAMCLMPFITREPSTLLASSLLCGAGALFLFWAYVIKPFTEYERAVVNQGVGRPLCIW